MRILLATGIYPPDIGGPATYVARLGEALRESGHEVTVITYGRQKSEERQEGQRGNAIVHVSKSGGPLLRWWRYARVLKKYGENADIVYAFSLVSCGVPVVLSGLRKPKKLLRLGGDFFWERYTDRGGMKSLAEWYKSGSLWQWVSAWILGHFDHIIFSTQFQEEIYAQYYRGLSAHSVIENPVVAPSEVPTPRTQHSPFRLLFFGRFVGFKNLLALIDAVAQLPTVTLTFVGSGPMKAAMEKRIAERGLQSRSTFLPPVHGEEKTRAFADHDLLVIPSVTEISPNTALEARASGLPVLLTEQTGLSASLAQGMAILPLITPEQIAEGIRKTMARYSGIAALSVLPSAERTWHTVAAEHSTLFASL